MRFPNRDFAAHQLADHLVSWKGQRPLVLGIPRGGVPMAQVVANALGGDLDVVLVRTLRAPLRPELAIGTVDESGAVLRFDVDVPVSELDMAREIDRQRGVIRVRRDAYGNGVDPQAVAGRVVIIVDDGIATGSTMLAAIHAVRRQQPARLIVAVAISSSATFASVRALVDDVVCLHVADTYRPINQYFEAFDTVDDDQVVEVLARARPAGSAEWPSW